MSKIRRKAVVLVLSDEREPWRSVEEQGIRQTWLTGVPKDQVDVLFYYGGGQSIRGDRLYFPFEESLENIGRKTLGAFEYVDTVYDYDFVFRTNTSSYLDCENYLKFLEQFDPEDHLYSAVKCVPPPGDPRPVFASGCGYTLSKRTLQFVLADRWSWDHSVIDDLALAKLMLKHMIPVTEAPRFDFGDFSDHKVFRVADAAKHFHLRCKYHSDRSIDIARMHKAFLAYLELRGV